MVLGMVVGMTMAVTVPVRVIVGMLRMRHRRIQRVGCLGADIHHFGGIVTRIPPALAFEMKRRRR